MISVTYKTEEWNKITTAALNTNTLAKLKAFTFSKVHNNFNPLPALTYQDVLDLNVTCRAKRTGMYVNLNAH
jgi:hypothetical protein